MCLQVLPSIWTLCNGFFGGTDDCARARIMRERNPYFPPILTARTHDRGCGLADGPAPVILVPLPPGASTTTKTQPQRPDRPTTTRLVDDGCGCAEFRNNYYLCGVAIRNESLETRTRS